MIFPVIHWTVTHLVNKC